MTCYELGILIHYYGRADDHDDFTRRPPVWQPTIDAFLDNGLLTLNQQIPTALDIPQTIYALTERGRVFVEQGLQRVPLPVQRWVMPSREDL